MRELLEELKEPLEDKEYRSAYASSFMNSYVAAQIKTLREQRSLTQQQLADLVGTKQAGISRLENVNYSAWKVETLTKLADAFDVRLKISFEEFGSLPFEISAFNKSSLQRAEFKDDRVFHPQIMSPLIHMLAVNHVNLEGSIRYPENNFSVQWPRSEPTLPERNKGIQPYMFASNTFRELQEVRL